jgi:V/A-type H+-transporting ATPase subunit I
MGIEGLMVCIQVLRLEFYEMFGRFYESGGKKFKPSMIDCTKKIDL